MKKKQKKAYSSKKVLGPGYMYHVPQIKKYIEKEEFFPYRYLWHANQTNLF